MRILFRGKETDIPRALVDQHIRTPCDGRSSRMQGIGHPGHRDGGLCAARLPSSTPGGDAPHPDPANIRSGPNPARTPPAPSFLLKRGTTPVPIPAVLPRSTPAGYNLSARGAEALFPSTSPPASWEVADEPGPSRMVSSNTAGNRVTTGPLGRGSERVCRLRGSPGSGSSPSCYKKPPVRRESSSTNRPSTSSCLRRDLNVGRVRTRRPPSLSGATNGGRA